LTVAQVKARDENGTRAGANALSLLATPLNVFVLQALAEGPKPLVGLRREVGSPPQTTMRGRLRTLTQTGVVTKRRQNDFPGSLDFELTASGRELWAVAEVVASWLAAAPEGPVLLGSVAAKSAIKALIEAWTTSMLRALAAKPLSLTELDSLISGLTYPSLERRLGAMRLAGQVEAIPGNGKGTPYAVTAWLRRAVAPLSAAVRWERSHLNGAAAPVGARDAESALLLAVPLLRLPDEISGSCRLVIEIGGPTRSRLAGVMVSVEEGRIASCVSRLEGHPDAWAVGPAAGWLAALIDLEADRLEVGGDGLLARGLIEGLHTTLFRSKLPA
jgi:DNA-binding HxlR family transcriptional regulator